MQPYRSSHTQEPWKGNKHALNCQSQSQQNFDLDRKHHRLLLWLASASTHCMDHSYNDPNHHNRHGTDWYETRQYLPESQPVDVRTATRTRQVPQRGWADVPLAYRPADGQDRAEVYRNFQQPVPREERASRERRRPEVLRNVASRHHHNAQGSALVDPAFLHPQASPYRDSHSIHSAPDALERGPQYSPSDMMYDSDSEDSIDFAPHPELLSYPPFEARSAQNDVNYPEDIISEEDVHLFAEATAGLGPDIGFQGFQPAPTLQPRNFAPATLYTQTSSYAPSTQQAPTTFQAFQQLAPTPQRPTARRPQLPRLRTEPAALSSTNTWLSSPSPVIEENRCGPADEQLPGYAESQAQARAVQATAARRRAQELQRRWQQSHG